MVEDNNQYWYGLIKEAIFGCEKDVKLNLTSECSSCHGKGGFNEKKCHTCGGTGKVLEQAQTIFGYKRLVKIVVVQVRVLRMFVTCVMARV